MVLLSCMATSLCRDTGIRTRDLQRPKLAREPDCATSRTSCGWLSILSRRNQWHCESPALVVRAVVAICLQQGPYCYGPLVCYVGIPGFEPGTPCSQSRCANRTALHPDNLIDSGDKSILKISNLQIFRAFFLENINFFRQMPTI